MKALRLGSLVVLSMTLLLFSRAARGATPTVLLNMEETRQFSVGQVNVDGRTQPVGAVGLVPGQVGKALQFHFIENARSGFFFAYPKATSDWDKAAGLSFWVKGDGSAGTGAIQLIANDSYSLRYAFCFPITSTEWHKVQVPWSAFVPEKTSIPLLGSANVKPSSVQAIGFGKWYYWGRYPGDYPAVTFAIDEIALQPTLPVDRKDYAPAQAGLPRTLAKLKAKRPLTLVTVGDSLSDKGHWANREVLWSEVLVQNLEQAYGSKITLVNPAVGGSQLTQGLVTAPRWLQRTPTPDLITICYGYNDLDDGATPALFKEKLRYVVDALRRVTQGQSEIALITTCPADSRWTEMEGLAAAVREVAQEKKTGLVDIAAAFHRAGDDDAAARQALYCSDGTHLGPAGHRLLALTAQQAIETGAVKRPAR